MARELGGIQLLVIERMQDGAPGELWHPGAAWFGFGSPSRVNEVMQSLVRHGYAEEVDHGGPNPYPCYRLTQAGHDYELPR